MEVSERAVQAAAEAIRAPFVAGKSYEEMATAALTAALPFLSALEPSAAREMALEEAARIAETTWPDSGPLDMGHGARIAAAIRALSCQPVSVTRPTGGSDD